MEAAQHRRSARAAALVGVGVMSSVDQIVFHQLLGWHHLYDRGTPEAALLWDGVLHAAELVLLVAGGVLLAGLRRDRILVAASAWGGGLVGAGAFQVFDGLVSHKVLRVHEIRYGVDLIPYDVAWNASGLVLLVAGLLVLRRAGPAAPAP